MVASMVETKSVGITFYSDDLLWLERIVVDKGKDEATKFPEMLTKRIEQAQKAHCKPLI